MGVVVTIPPVPMSDLPEVITEPKVHVLGSTRFYPHPDFPIPTDGTDAEKLGSFAAKGCYDSFGRDGRENRDNQRRVIGERHGSVLEHSTINFYITGISRGLSLELNRHRHGAISQRSTRYTAEEDAAIVLEPKYALWWKKLLAGEATDKERTFILSHLLHQKTSLQQYIWEVESLMEMNPDGLSGTALRKWARGKARNVMPHSLETRGVWSFNYRGLRHILEARSSKYAESEIRRLAEALLLAAEPFAPTYFEDYVRTDVGGEGEVFLELTTPNQKV